MLMNKDDQSIETMGLITWTALEKLRKASIRILLISDTCSTRLWSSSQASQISLCHKGTTDRRYKHPLLFKLWVFVFTGQNPMRLSAHCNGSHEIT